MFKLLKIKGIHTVLDLQLLYLWACNMYPILW